LACVHKHLLVHATLASDSHGWQFIYG